MVAGALGGRWGEISRIFILYKRFPGIEDDCHGKTPMISDCRDLDGGSGV